MQSAHTISISYNSTNHTLNSDNSSGITPIHNKIGRHTVFCETDLIVARIVTWYSTYSSQLNSGLNYDAVLKNVHTSLSRLLYSHPHPPSVSGGSDPLSGNIYLNERSGNNGTPPSNKNGSSKFGTESGVNFSTQINDTSPLNCIECGFEDGLDIYTDKSRLVYEPFFASVSFLLVVFILRLFFNEILTDTDITVSASKVPPTFLSTSLPGSQHNRNNYSETNETMVIPFNELLELVRLNIIYVSCYDAINSLIELFVRPLSSQFDSPEACVTCIIQTFYSVYNYLGYCIENKHEFASSTEELTEEIQRWMVFLYGYSLI